MTPRIQTIKEKYLIGFKKRMSFAANATHELWQSFMPRRKEITNNLNSDLYSAEVYDKEFFKEFDPNRPFDKWAAVELTDLNHIPAGMEKLDFPGGLYAVFIHKGPASEGYKTYQYIFEKWLPSSGYKVDQRPHFAVMGEKYKNDDPDSEEEIWIPVVWAVIFGILLISVIVWTVILMMLMIVLTVSPKYLNHTLQFRRL